MLSFWVSWLRQGWGSGWEGSPGCGAGRAYSVSLGIFFWCACEFFFLRFIAYAEFFCLLTQSPTTTAYRVEEVGGRAALPRCIPASLIWYVLPEADIQRKRFVCSGSGL